MDRIHRILVMTARAEISRSREIRSGNFTRGSDEDWAFCEKKYNEIIFEESKNPQCATKIKFNRDLGCSVAAQIDCFLQKEEARKCGNWKR